MTAPAVVPRPLVRSLDPLSGESLAGYVLRLADRQDRTPNAITGRVGLRGDDGKAPAGLVLGLPPAVLAAFSTACSLDPEEAVALTLADRVGTLLAQQGRTRNDSVLQAATAAWISPGRTRYCPDCLRGDGSWEPGGPGLAGPGYWRASWQLPWHYACIRHMRLLRDDCPACRAPVGRATPRGAFGSLVPNPGAEGLPFDACRHRPDGPDPCGHGLSEPGGDDERRVVDPGWRALASQVRLEELIGLDGPPETDPLLAGEPLPLPLWTAALQGVAVLVRASLGLPGAPAPDPALLYLARALADPATPEAERRRALHPNTPPDGAWAASALVSRAVAVLDAPTHGDLAERLAPYREPVREHSPGIWKSWLRQYPDDRVKRLLKRHGRWGGLAVAARAAPAAPALRGEHLAQRIPPPHDQHLDPYRALGVGDTGLHRVTNVLLWQRVESARSRAEAAAALGYADPGTVDGTVHRLQQALRAAGRIGAYQTTLDRLAADLAAAPLIDWAARRVALADWTVPDADWADLRPRMAALQKRDGRQPDWDLRRLVLSQIIWEDLSGGEPHASPAFRLVPPDEKSRTRLRNVSTQFRRHVADGTLPGFAPIIGEYREHVARALPDGPTR